jgi:rhodanese-related sulfurtransferase
MSAPTPRPDDVDVSPAETLRRHAAREVQLVDVREDHEVRAGHIDGARHIAMHELAQQAGTLDRDRPVIFYCRLGARSAMAAHAFRRAGYDAWSMTGGLQAWVAGSLPIEPEDGFVADH